MKKPLLTLTMALAAMVAATTASAFSWNEWDEPVGAGQSLATAHEVTGVGSLDAINGVVWGGTDLYKIYLTGDPFFASVTTDNGFNSQLFLFDDAGIGVLANDDTVGVDPQLLSPGLSAGVYYLGLTIYDRDPYTEFGALIFPTAPTDGLYGPTTLDPLSYWGGTEYVYNGEKGGHYTISLRGAEGVIVSDTHPCTREVPEPGTLLLMGAGLLGSALLARRRKEV